MKYIISIRLLVSIAICMGWLPVIMAQDSSAHQLVDSKTGRWNVVMTMRPALNEAIQTVKDLTATRTLVGDFCLHEVMQPGVGARIPAFQRLADLAWNKNEQRWDYMSIDSRITAGIMFFIYQDSQGDSIRSFINSFPSPGFGADQKGGGIALHVRNVVVLINKDHDMVKQYWRTMNGPEWLAVQYDYTR